MQFCWNAPTKYYATLKPAFVTYQYTMTSFQVNNYRSTPLLLKTKSNFIYVPLSPITVDIFNKQAHPDTYVISPTWTVSL